MANSMKSILEADELHLLEGLSFKPRRQLASHLRGERLSRQKGVSVEFADYRDYIDGDDLRHLDWNLLARLDRPTIRTYQDEAELPITIGVDVSGSMDFGQPSKLRHACTIASALGFIGLSGHDRVQMLQIGNPNAQPSRPMHGRASVRALQGWLDALTCTGRVSLSDHLNAIPSLRPGLFFIISDGLDPKAPSNFGAIAARGHELVLIQVLSPSELDPDLEGDLRLVDSESASAVELTANIQTIEEYKENLNRHCRALQESVVKHGGRFLTSVVGQTLEDFVNTGLRRSGLVQ